MTEPTESIPDRDSADALTPNAVLVWDNAARSSLPSWMYGWLGFLVTVNLLSMLFLRDHMAPIAVLAGFITSHIFVVAFAYWPAITVRRGTVSLLHVLCWTPGWIACLIDLLHGSDATVAYQLWTGTLVVTNSIAFRFDVRDAVAYLRWLAR